MPKVEHIGISNVKIAEKLSAVYDEFNEPEEPIDERIANHVRDIEATILKNIEVNTENAIELNLKFRESLQVLLNKLKDLRHKLRERYKSNVIKLQAKRPEKVSKGRLTTILSCGMPFFKDRNYYSAPYNQDYINSRDKLKHFTPLDVLGMRSSSWTAKDKTKLIMAIKRQIIDYLKLGNKQINLAGLIMMVDKKFKIDWSTIAWDFNNRHSESGCQAMWFEYLHPNIRRAPWTKTEDELLLASVKYKKENWAEIAKAVPNRSKFQCFIRYQLNLSELAQVKNEKWTKEEDKLLLDLVEEHRVGSYIPWAKIREEIPSRNKIQIYHRFHLSVKPTINHEKFTTEEDCIMMAAVQEFGPEFYKKLSPDLLPGRTIVQIRNRYKNALQFAGKHKHWNYEDDKKLMELIKTYGTSNWSGIAKEILNHTRFSCRTRYLVITKFLKKNPDKTLADVPKKKKLQRSSVTVDNWLSTLYEIKEQESIPDYAAYENYKTFYNKLQIICVLYYNFFKYSHKFKYSEILKADNNDYNNSETYYLLSCNLNIDLNVEIEENDFLPRELNQLSKLNYFHDNLREHFMVNLRYKYIPPNWNTIMLGRNLTLEFWDCRQREIWQTTTETSNIEEKNLEKVNLKKKNDAIDLFKMRLKSLLKLPMLLSKIDPQQYSTIEQPADNGDKSDFEDSDQLLSDDDDDDNDDDYDNNDNFHNGNGKLDKGNKRMSEDIEIKIDIKKLKED